MTIHFSLICPFRPYVLQRMKMNKMPPCKKSRQCYLANIFNLLSGCSIWHPPLHHLRSTRFQKNVHNFEIFLSSKCFHSRANHLSQLAVKDAIRLGVASQVLCRRGDGRKCRRSRSRSMSRRSCWRRRRRRRRSWRRHR